MRVERSIAATWAPPGSAAARPAEGDLARALSREGAAREYRVGQMHIAATGRSLTLDGDSLCVLDGALDDLPALRRLARVGPDATAEAALLAAYRRLGVGFLPGLIGDFALLIATPRSFLVARDPDGVRGMHWVRSAGACHFSSEVAPLLMLPRERPAPDPRSVSAWLALQPLPEDSTLYSGVRRLLAGHALLMTDGNNVVMHRYWAPRYEPPSAKDLADSVRIVAAGLPRLVEDRLDTTHPTGVLLSGGLDSMSIAAVAARADPSCVRGYTAAFPEFPHTDETERVDDFARATGITGVRLRWARGGLLAGGLDHIERWGVPPAGWSDFWEQPLLRRAAEDGIRVVVHGEGGDEAFGQRTHVIADYLQRLRPARAISLLQNLGGVGRNPFGPDGRHHLMVNGIKSAAPRSLHGLVGHRAEQKRSDLAWMSPAARSAALDATDTWGWKALDGPPSWSWPTHILTAHVDGYGALDHIRRRARWAGLATRSPYLGRGALALTNAGKPEHTLDPFRDRVVMRMALDELLPSSILRSTGKAYFNTMIHDQLTRDHHAIVSVLTAPAAAVSSFVDRQGLASMLSDGPTRFVRHPFFWAQYVLRLTMVECWLREEQTAGAVSELQRRGGFSVGNPSFGPVPSA